jgi:hypothetical protein
MPEGGQPLNPFGKAMANLAASAMTANLNRDDKIALQRALRAKGKKKRKK